MSKVLDTVLLFALPASGKSEVRHYLDGLSAEECRDGFHMGQTIQLDDYPYVHFMHRIDDELALRDLPYVFYKGPDRPFVDDYEWGTLVELLNEDYHDLMAGHVHNPPSASQLLFDRLDNARAKVGLPRELACIPYGIRCDIADAMEDEVRDELEKKNEICKMDREGKTIVMEAARGGPNGAAFPLTPPHGYGYLFSRISSEILDRASVLYVWVTPEESRRKNIERGKPDAQGSILHHSVPMEVMLDQYGCDDMDYLQETAEKENTIKVQRNMVVGDGAEKLYELRTWHLPVARFDNRNDLTSFLRNDREEWKEKEISSLHNGLKDAFSLLARLNNL